MNMMTVAVFLCTAALAAGLSSTPDAAPVDAAPADAAPPAEMEPPADLVPTVDCKNDAGCRLADQTAKCSDGQCECSKSSDKTRFCTGDLRGLITFTIAFTFGGADCSAFKKDPAAEKKLRTSLLGSAVFRLTGYNILCGSVIMVASAEATADKIDAALIAATDSVVQAQASIPSIANATLSTSVVVGKGQHCSVTNAASTVLIEDKICYPTCNTGYTRVEVTKDAKTVYECHDSDSSMAGGVIAGIVIGCVVGAAVVVAAIYYCYNVNQKNKNTKNAPNRADDASV